MIIWWRGHGLLVVVIAAAAGLIGAAVGGREGGGIGVMASSFVIGLVGWALNIKGRQDDRRNEHSLCSIPVQYWPLITLIVGLNIWRL